MRGRGVIIAWCVALVQSTPQVDFTDNPHSQQSFAFYDGRLLDQVRQGDQHVHQFFRLLALCHTVMPEFKEGTSPPASYHQLRSAVPWEYSAHTVSAVWVIPCMHLAASSESAGHNTTAASALLADR